MEKNNKITELVEVIKLHNDMYRRGKPIVPDSVYDKEVEMLHNLDPDNDWFKVVEPVPVGDKRKVSLPIKMKSLYKVKDIADLKKWTETSGLLKNSKVVIMPKYDGLSLLCEEATGMAYSRGGAENEGQNCAPHLKTNGAKLDPKFLYTYGEFVFSVNNWNTYFAGKTNPESGDSYKSPRNTAVGLINRDVPINDLKYVDFYRYGVDENTLEKYDTYESLIHELCSVYNQPHLYKVVKVSELSDEMMLDLYKSWRHDYYIDGLVLYTNNIADWGRLGRQETTGNPLYAIAYKHPDFTDTFETTVTGITWGASKSGALKPVVNIEKVNTGDCEMDSPTGYNAGWIRDMKIAPGAKVVVTRSGGVIPKILEAIEPSSYAEQCEMWDEISVCPYCGSPTSWNENYVELMCTNPLCAGTREAKVMFFFNTCGAENMGEETVSKMFQCGLNSAHAILHTTFEDLLKVDGVGETFANIIITNNKRILNDIDLPTLMQASCSFQGIGKIKAQQILDSLDKDVVEMLYNNEPLGLKIPSKDELKSMSKTMQSFWSGIASFQNFIFRNGIKINKPESKIVNSNGKCKGMNVCFSGVRSIELETQITEEGGFICSGVTKKTTHLIVKDKNAISSKIVKAKELGIPIINIDDFLID